jgi:hypothetical protein
MAVTPVSATLSGSFLSKTGVQHKGNIRYEGGGGDRGCVVLGLSGGGVMWVVPFSPDRYGTTP